MIINATFWVATSFFIFLCVLIYFKVPQKILSSLEENISNIKKQIIEAEKLKDEAKNILTENERKISVSKDEVKLMINNANEQAEKEIIRTNEEFHNLMERRKKGAEERIRQLKNQSIKDIKKDEELSYDYGFGYDKDYKQFPCKCAAKNCCGYIVREGSRWRIKNKKKSVNNFFQI